MVKMDSGYFDLSVVMRMIHAYEGIECRFWCFKLTETILWRKLADTLLAV